jgi:RecD/TraA family predicted helicase
LIIIGEYLGFDDKKENLLIKTNSHRKIIIKGFIPFLQVGKFYEFDGFYLDKDLNILKVKSFKVIDVKLRNFFAKLIPNDEYKLKITNETIDKIDQKYGVGFLTTLFDLSDEDLKDISLSKDDAKKLIYAFPKDSKDLKHKLFYWNLYRVGFEHDDILRVFNKLIDLRVEDFEEFIRKNPYVLVVHLPIAPIVPVKAYDDYLGNHHQDEYQHLSVYSALYHCIMNSGKSNVYSHFISNYFIRNLVELSSIDLHNSLDYLLDKKYIIKIDNSYTLTYLYEQEKMISNNIRLLTDMDTFNLIDEVNFEYIIEEIETNKNLKYSNDQKKAIYNSANNHFYVVTGGPGTGKTEIISAIFDLFGKIKKSKPVVVLTPTGIAAQRINIKYPEVKAMTMHRKLGYNGYRYVLDPDNAVEDSIVIVDEMSMVDENIFYHLLDRYGINSNYILLGDENQLPAVGLGNILNVILNYGKTKFTKLSKIYRQSQESNILKLAHYIVTERTNFPIKEYNDLKFIPCEDIMIQSNLLERYKYHLKTHSVLDISVLVPVYEGIGGIKEMNKFIQSNVIKSSSPTFFKNGYDYYIGDKIIQLTNNYDASEDENGLMNGQIGIIVDIDTTKGIIVTANFNGKNFIFSASTDSEHTIDTISLAYCVSVHKSQGCEHEVVLLPLNTNVPEMFDNRLFYTAVTRAKSNLEIIGCMENIDKIIVKKKNNRFSNVKVLLNNEENLKN